MQTNDESHWHSLSLQSALARLSAQPQGLSTAEARRRLAECGANALPTPPSPGFAGLFFRQFVSPFIYVLLVAAVVSLGVGNIADAIFIGAILLANATIGSLQEYHAHRSAVALRNLMVTHVRVRRDGHVLELPSEQLVPGDCVLLSSGDRVAADMRLLEAVGLETDESFLTGESLPVTKDNKVTLDADTPVPDRLNLTYAGSLVTTGRGLGLVIATGLRTEMGRLALSLETAEIVKPPLFQRIERFSKNLTVALLVVVALLALIEFARQTPPLTVFMTVIALAVSAIPEGLPVALTVVLSISMRRMVRRHVIVRKLVAVESLGACTVIAADKTGTLTLNRLVAREVDFIDGRGFLFNGEGPDSPEQGSPLAGQVQPGDNVRLSRLVRVAALCNEAELHRLLNGDWHSSGDTVDQALLVLAHKNRLPREQLLRRHPQLGQIHYEPATGFAATLHSDGDGKLACVKGALEKLLPMCSRMASDSGDIPLQQVAANTAMERLTEKGARVLALAEGSWSESVPFTAENLKNLCLLGLVAMIDPLRPEAARAVAECRAAGIRVCMLTGDHPSTALTIARELALTDHQAVAITGAELARAEALGTEAVDALTAEARVYARVAPEQKLTIVQSLIRQGEFVAVTGDGVNDAPALNAAHVGVAMGLRGTDIAKEAADLLLTDDNFASVVAGVEEGRIAYQNIRKVVFFLISTGAAEVCLFILASAFGMPLPLTAVQLLWLNLVTSGVQHIALALEPGEGDEMQKPPRPPRERLFNDLMLRRVLISGLNMGGLCFLLFSGLLALGWDLATARNSTLLLMVLFENVQVLNSRSESRSAFRQSLLGNPTLLLGTMAAQALHILAMYWPMMQQVLEIAPVSLSHWWWLLAVALMQVLAMELVLVYSNWRRGRQL